MKPFFRPGLAVSEDSGTNRHATDVPSDAAEKRVLESAANAMPVMSPLVSIARCAHVARHSPCVLKICGPGHAVRQSIQTSAAKTATGM